MNIADCLKEIRAYTSAHPELQNAHHFLFDLPVGSTVPTACDAVVMGLNPREKAYQRQRWPITSQMKSAGEIFEESRERDFMHPDVRDWTKLIVDVCGTDNMIQTEGFFWSSEDIRKDFVAKFGTLPKKAVRHLDFCKCMNAHLFNEYGAPIVVCAGYEFREVAIQQYGLALVNRVMRLNPNMRGSLIEEYTDGRRPWVFTPHWTNGRGLTGVWTPAVPTSPTSSANDERATIRSYVRRAIDLSRQQLNSVR